MDVAGKTAVVTGAGSGIGRVIALRLAGDGAAVVVNDIDEAAGSQTVEEIAERGGTASFIRADVTSAPEIEAMVGQAGGLDILVNNAGGFPYPVFPEAELEHWSQEPRPQSAVGDGRNPLCGSFDGGSRRRSDREYRLVGRSRPRAAPCS